jgi:hypothetical protein
LPWSFVTSQEHGLVARLDRHDDLGAFARCDLHQLGLVRPLEQPRVAADLPEPPIVGEAEVVDTGVGRIHHPEPHEGRGGFDVRVVRAVHQDRVAEDARGAGEGRRMGERAVVVEALVLDDQRDVVDAVGVRQLDVACRVVHDEHAGGAPVDVIGGRTVKVGMKPERRSRLVDRPRG